MTRCKLVFSVVVLLALALASGVSAQPGLHSNLDDGSFVGYEASSDYGAARADAAFPSVASTPGCVTDFLDVNFSSRAGVAPRLLVLHYTVSPNRAGWSDVDLIRGLFNRDSFDASSTWIVDFEGNCKYIVDQADKPWTQTFYNPWSLSVEIIATGRESRSEWLASAGLVKTARIFAAAAKRYDIPIRFVDPDASCVTPPKGITDHEALDCRNSHTDVRPNFPYTRFLELVRQAAAPPPPPKFQFILLDGEGTALAKSAPFLAGGDAEALRYSQFLANTKALGLAAVRQDNDVRLVRRKVAP